jgi:hypothetical protein
VARTSSTRAACLLGPSRGSQILLASKFGKTSNSSDRIRKDAMRTLTNFPNQYIFSQDRFFHSILSSHFREILFRFLHQLSEGILAGPARPASNLPNAYFDRRHMSRSVSSGMFRQPRENPWLIPGLFSKWRCEYHAKARYFS